MKPHALTVLLLAATAFASSDVVEESLRITPPGATDLVPLKHEPRESAHADALTVTADIWYPPEYTKCYLREHEVELGELFTPESPIKVPLIKGMNLNESEGEK